MDDRTVVPELVRKYPHDGQIGLDVFAVALNGGFTFAVIALIIGILLIYKTSKRTRITVQRDT